MGELPNGYRLLSTGEERTQSILSDSQGIISFDTSSVYPGHQAYSNPWYSFDFVGDSAVSDNASNIEYSAAKYGVDPDLLRAVVYLENTHGWYDVLDPSPTSARPGNINPDLWAGLLGVPPAFVHVFPSTNIALTAKLLSEIQERLPGATPAAIATLYNNMRADMVSGYGLTVEQYMESRPWDQCFPAHTPIAISPTETRPISDIRVGDTVLAFDPAADLGRGALVPRKVVRLYRNTTEEWVKLTWAKDGEAKELIATPGHHFLDRFGSFPTIEEMLDNGRATVVLASRELTEVTAEWTNWRAAA